MIQLYIPWEEEEEEEEEEEGGGGGAMMKIWNKNTGPDFKQK